MAPAIRVLLAAHDEKVLVQISAGSSIMSQMSLMTRVRATDGAVDAGGAIHNLEGKLDAEAFLN